MTKDEWQEAERRALWKYGGLTLLVDGYKISANGSTRRLTKASWLFM